MYLRTVLTALGLLVAFCPIVLAGVQEPSRVPCWPGGKICPPISDFILTGQGAPCQFRFRADGGLDELCLLVTLRDGFGSPVMSCSTTATLEPNAETLDFCSCEGTSHSAVTDSDGVAMYCFSRIGGRGEIDLVLTAHCAGQISIYEETILFTSPDLNGSCEPSQSTTVLDFGLWAQGLPPNYRQAPDFDCSGHVDVIDLGTLAGGLGRGCGDEVSRSRYGLSPDGRR